MMYSCDDSNDLLHAFLTLTCPSGCIAICQYIAILWVQYTDMAKYNIVPALLHTDFSQLEEILVLTVVISLGTGR